MENVEFHIRNKEDWDFAGEDTQYLTHGIHPYPAKMIPPIAKKLLHRYANPGDVVLDPFCGSGTVLVEARLVHMNSIGIDINPLACFITKVKSTPLDPRLLERYWGKIKAKIANNIRLFKFRQINGEIETPDFSDTNIEYWFKPYVLKELTIIQNQLEKMLSKESKIHDFFRVCFSATVRQVSGTRKNEYKLYRIPEKKWRTYRPDVLTTFINKVEKSISKMASFYQQSKNDVFSKVFRMDTQEIFSEEYPEVTNFLLNNRPSVIVTSPPYGDSRTTVAYGQFSRYSSLWLGFEKKVAMNVDKLCLGGEANKLEKDEEFGPEVLSQTLEILRERDEDRAKEVAAYFYDLYTCLKKLYEVLDQDGHCCIVISNRTVKRLRIPTHVIIAKMGVDVGFDNHITIYPRKIPKKRLPWKNAPENIPGLKGETMSKENIVVLKR